MKLRILLMVGSLFFAVVFAPRVSAQATIHVTTSAPGNSNGGCSLQEAIYSANFDQAIAIDTVNPDHFYTTGCEPGSGTDTIELPSGSVFQMTAIVDDAYNEYGPTATPIIFTNIIIEANGSRLELVPGSPNMRAFSVGFVSSVTTPGGAVAGGNGNLTIRNVHIKGFAVKGGDGASGGGGGMGAGGAIYMNGGGLTVVNSTFEGNSAAGGNGSTQVQPGPGGGGGGLFGNGGLAIGNSDLLGTGGGGGGGGSRGNGASSETTFDSGEGGGGGGTVDSALSNSYPSIAGGFNCGGDGGSGSDGSDGSCPGGGGGAGSAPVDFGFGIYQGGDGGNGKYGGGGGGGGFLSADVTGRQGGDGGFGGGGGAGGFSDKGGDAGFGAGGGAGASHNGKGSPAGGGQATSVFGGGGSAFGGAIFSHGGQVTVENSTFNANGVSHGFGGGVLAQAANPADSGIDAGGAIFSVFDSSFPGSLTVMNATISGNTGTGANAGIFVFNNGAPKAQASFTLDNTIIANNGADECAFGGSVTYAGVGNLIVNDFGCTGLAITPSPDPQLGPLQINAPGITPTMAIQPGTPAVDVADVSTSLSYDQRGVSRPQGAGFDVGAFEAGAPEADLVLAKAVSSSTAQIGDTLTYTLTVTNLGPQTANSVQLSDTLPASLTFVSCSATGGGVCGGSGNSVTVTYTTLAANSPVTITLQATLNSGVADGTMVTNNASVSATSPLDPNSSNNSASASFAVQNKADLVVTKSVSAKFVEVGDQVTYTVKLTNNGPYAAKSVVLSDTAPNGVTFNSCSSTVGTCNLSAGLATLSIPSLTNGASATISIQATLNFGVNNGATVTNTAAVTAGTFDPNTSNNSATASFTAENRSDLVVTNLPNLIVVKPGSDLTYTVTVLNLGPFKAKSIVLTDPVPLNTTFVSLKSGGVSCTAPAVGAVGTVTCNVGSLPFGAWATVAITVKVGSPANVTSITNTSTANAATFDPYTPNNSARATTLVVGNKK